jgi:hypothetical protein
VFALETGRAIDTQSPFGESMVGTRWFVDANAPKAATVSREGWVNAFTFVYIVSL